MSKLEYNVSRLSLGLVPNEIAIPRLQQLNAAIQKNVLDEGELKILSQKSLGFEAMLTQLELPSEVFKQVQEKGLYICGVHAPIAATGKDYSRDIGFFLSNKNIKELVYMPIWYSVFGTAEHVAQRERGNPFDLAVESGGYVLLHSEPMFFFGKEKIKELQQKGMKIVWEIPGWDQKNNRFDPRTFQLNEMVKTAEEFDVGVIIDLATAMITGKNQGFTPAELFRALENRVAGVHFSVAKGNKENLVPGSTDEDPRVRKFVHEMKDHDGELDVILEVIPKPTLFDAVKSSVLYIHETQ